MIDKQSAKFIRESMITLRNSEEYNSLIKRVLQKTMDFFLDTPQELMILFLKAKLEKGAEEYGYLKTDKVEIAFELIDEMLDLLGWQLILDEINDKK